MPIQKYRRGFTSSEHRPLLRPSRGEFGFVKALCNVVVQIGILDDFGGDRFIAEPLGFREAAIPIASCKIALTHPIKTNSSERAVRPSALTAWRNAAIARSPRGKGSNPRAPVGLCSPRAGRGSPRSSSGTLSSIASRALRAVFARAAIRRAPSTVSS